MTDTAEISIEAKRAYDDEQHRATLDIGREAYARMQLEDTEEIPTCPHEERQEVTPMAMNVSIPSRWWLPFCILCVAVVLAVAPLITWVLVAGMDGLMWFIGAR